MSRGAREPRLEETRVADRVFVWTLGGDRIETSFGANCGAVIGRRGVLLVDPLIAPPHARRVREALRRATSLPVTHVALTHHHTDHALGSSIFAAEGAAIVAHRRCAEAIAAEHPGLIDSRRRRPDLSELFAEAVAPRPTEIFETEIALDLGDLEARIRHPGHGHTPGDAVIHVPSESLVFCGDLVSNGYHVNFEDASLEGLGTGLETLEGLGARTCVPGHGAPGGREILGQQRRYHETVRETIHEAVSRGWGQAQIVEELAARFPDHRLEAVLEQTAARWRDWEKAAPLL